jgi:hypothetical protein
VPRDARLINFFRQILFKIGSEEYSFQKKKKKKRKPFVQVEGFNKASFSDKILPDRVEILSETRRA